MLTPPRTRFVERDELIAKGWAVVLGIVFTPISGAAAYLSGARGFVVVLAALGGGLLAGFVAYRLSSGVARSAGAGFEAFIQPSGKSTPYETQFSQGLALEAADKTSEALEWFEAEVARLPADARVRVVAAEVCQRAGQHRRAEALFVEARRLASDRATELYTTQRLIDLRLGPLREPERAFPELRRVVDRFAGTPEADGARAALVRLKAEQRSL